VPGGVGDRLQTRDGLAGQSAIRNPQWLVVLSGVLEPRAATR
jgi:hypothetical protein